MKCQCAEVLVPENARLRAEVVAARTACGLDPSDDDADVAGAIAKLREENARLRGMRERVEARDALDVVTNS